VAAEHSGQSIVYDRVPALFLAVDEPEEQVGASDSLFPQTSGAITLVVAHAKILT
jgi:hypothetical protein